MAQRIGYSPLTEPHSIFNGFLSGCLIAGGVFAPYGLLLQAVLLVAGIFMLVDSLLPSGEIMYGASVLLFSIIGFAVTALLALWGVELLFMLLIVLLTAVSYFFRFSSKKRKRDNA